MEKVLFTDPDTQETVEFQVEDETQMNGMKYLLVSEESNEEEDDTFNAYILKEIKDDNGEVTYQVVEDEVEFMALAGVFKLLSDEETDIVF